MTMKTILAFIVMITGVSAHAQFDPTNFFNGIFNLIENEINKNDKVVLEDDGDQIILGRGFLDRNKEVDTVNLPNCSAKSGNQRVSRLRLIVRRNPAYIEDVRIRFQNGQSQNFRVRSEFKKGQSSGWVRLTSGGNNRCIRSIRVTGAVPENVTTSSLKPDVRSAVNFVGEIQ